MWLRNGRGFTAQKKKEPPFPSPRSAPVLGVCFTFIECTVCTKPTKVDHWQNIYICLHSPLVCPGHPVVLFIQNDLYNSSIPVVESFVFNLADNNKLHGVASSKRLHSRLWRKHSQSKHYVGMRDESICYLLQGYWVGKTREIAVPQWSLEMVGRDIPWHFDCWWLSYLVCVYKTWWFV